MHPGAIAWLPALVAAFLGAAVGAAARDLLAGVPRGADLARMPLVLATGAVTGVGAGLAWRTPTLALVVWAGWLLVALGGIDLAVHRLPDALTLPAVPLTLLVVAVTDAAAPGAGSVPRAVLVALALTAMFAVLAAVAPAAMGRGDVKLVPSLGLLTGFVSVPATVMFLVVAFVVAAAASLLGVATRRLTLRSAIPFGPFLLVGAWLVLAVPGVTAMLTG